MLFFVCVHSSVLSSCPGNGPAFFCRLHLSQRPLHDDCVAAPAAAELDWAADTAGESERALASDCRRRPRSHSALSAAVTVEFLLSVHAPLPHSRSQLKLLLVHSGPISHSRIVVCAFVDTLSHSRRHEQAQHAGNCSATHSRSLPNCC